jgi:SAM-dependent methyltransferase
MESFARDYNWEGAGKPHMLNALPDDGRFDLITAFDIIEHLEKPNDALTHIRHLLKPHGLMFVTVPNKWTVREFATKLRGPKGLPPGQPHIQFKSPSQWRQVFRECDFEILDHDMAIGPIVNTTEFISYQLKLSVFHRAVAKFLDKIDRYLKPLTKGLYGWNLFVLKAAGNR